jgi:hypothetical protein
VSSIDPPRPRVVGDLVRALIEEAWRRARRRRLVYAGVVFSVALIGAIVLATLPGPSTSSSSAPALVAGPNGPARFVGSGEHIYRGVFRCAGKRGSFTVSLRFGSSGSRSWGFEAHSISTPPLFARTGQYGKLARSGGGGRRVQAGGHASEWYARLFGVVHSSRGVALKQHVVIELTGRPSGTFRLTPTEPGVLERDSGTQSSGWLG